MAEDNRVSDLQKDGAQRLRWKDYLLYYLGYTLLFCVMAAAVFCWFWFRKRRFVWQTDGVNQHYYGLVYFSRWGKAVLRQFRETGVLRVPTYSLRMGYGEDIFTTLAYYVIGDPFNLPAVFVPERYLLVFHDLMLLARFWLAGITFSAFSFYMGRRSRIGVLAGALIYVFNGFTMSGMRHHYFLNPFVFFPLLLIGCELYFRKKRPLLFIFMVFVTAVSNFYFFYMLVIMTVLYAVWRSIRLHGLAQLGRVLLDGIAFTFYGIIGTLLAAFMLLPVVLRFLQDPRTKVSKAIPYLWREGFYRNFLDCFLSNSTSALAGSWTHMGFGAVALLCVLFIFAGRRKHTDLKAAFIGLTALLLTPAAGFALNGFSYPANRWMWAYALLIGFMTATAVPEIAEAGVRQLAAACIAFAAAAAVCVAWKYTFSRSSAQAVILALAGLGAVLLGRVALLEKLSGGAVLRRKASVSAQAALLVCVMLTICSEAYFYYSPDRAGKVAEYLSRAQIETQTAKDAAAAKELIDGALLQERTAGGGVTADPAGEAAAERAKGSGDGPGPFYRYSTDNPENNTSLLYGVSNTQYYWSLSNTNVSQFMNETGQLNQWVDMYDTLDNRTFLNEIAGIRYYLGNDTDALPFGYEKKEGYSYDNTDLWAGMDQLDRFSCDLYENTYALPFGFTTDRWISRADYEGMDIPARQEALMQGIVLEKDPGTDFGQTAPILTARSVPFNLVFDAEKVTAEGVPETADTAAGTSMMSLPACSFTQEGGEVLTFRFNGVQDCETYLYIRGLEYRPKDGQESRTMLRLPVTGYAGEEAAVSKLIGFSTPEDPWTTGRKDFLVNMGYKRIPPDRIELTFPAAGTFSFDSIEIVCQPMSAYPAQAQALAAEGMTELDIHEMGDSFATDRITGQVDVTGPKILCLQIPRTAGWTAYVDGMRAELLQADTMFSALLLAEGSHSIELRYQTPGLRLGAVISIGMLLLLLVFGVIYTIVSLLLHVREKRVEAVPEGTFREEITADSDREQAADKSSGRITQQPDPETADGKR